MTVVHVFDPAMCCSSGVCGTSVDPHLARFAADLDWLRSQGVSVERFNLSQQPAAFAADTEVKDALEAKGEEALPLVKVNGNVRSIGTYPSREDLASWAGVAAPALPAAAGETSSSSPSACCPPSPTQEASARKNSGCC
jgi:hypothetical protein